MDFSKNRCFALFFDSGAPRTISDRSGMQKYSRGLIFSSGAQFWTSFVDIGSKNPNLETRFFFEKFTFFIKLAPDPYFRGVRPILSCSPSKIIMKDGYKVLGRLYKTFFLSGGVAIFLEKIRVRICGFFDICNRLRRLREGPAT